VLLLHCLGPEGGRIETTENEMTDQPDEREFTSLQAEIDDRPLVEVTEFDTREEKNQELLVANAQRRKKIHPKKKAAVDLTIVSDSDRKDRLTRKDLMTMSELHLVGYSPKEISVKLETSTATVYYHLKNTLPVIWAEAAGSGSIELELAKLAEWERTAWAAFRASQGEIRTVTTKELASGAGVEVVTKIKNTPGNKAWLDMAMDVADRRAKLMGLYAPEQHVIQAEAIRVGGVDPSEFDKAMNERVKNAVEGLRAKGMASELLEDDGDVDKGEPFTIIQKES